MMNLHQIWWNLSGWTPFWTIRQPFGIIDRRLPPVDQLKIDASHLRTLLSSVIRKDPYMSIYRMDMDSECPLWARSDVCTSGGMCTVESCCLDDVPHEILDEDVVKIDDYVYDPWLQVENSNAAMMGAPSFGESLAPANFEFYDLAINTPGNTNYRGRSLWGYIYENTCLHDNGKTLMEDAEPSLCSEEGAYFKMISGMQTLIATLNAEHADDDALVSFNITYFKNAVAWNKEWITNMYFTFGMLERAACKIAPLLNQLKCPNDQGDVAQACDGLVDFLEQRSAACKTLEEMPIFVFDNLAVNAVHKLQEMSSIMDCIECQKCRLHARVKIDALTTVVKATSPNGVVSMGRNEIVAFLHALDYFAEGIDVVEKFESRRKLITLTASCLLGLVILGIRAGIAKYLRRLPSDAKKKID